MSAFDEATLKKNFGGKPSSKLTLKKNGTTVVATVILEVMDWRCVLQIFWNNSILKKSWTLNPNQFLSQEMYVTITILEWLVSTWHMFDRYSWGKISQIEWSFDSNLKSFS